MMLHRGIALLLSATAFFSATFPLSNAAAIEPEKQPIYTNVDIVNHTACGIDTAAFSPVPCTVPAGQRLIIEHVSGFVLMPASANTTAAVSLIVTDTALGLNGAASIPLWPQRRPLRTARMLLPSPQLSG